MGRFDALTQIEDTEQPKPSSPAASSPTLKQPTAPEEKTHRNETKKPDIMNSGNHETPSPVSQFKEKPVTYSTLLDPVLVKKNKTCSGRERDQRL